MKTLILKIAPLLLMVIWAGSMQAQIGTTAGTVTTCPGEVVVPINVTNCNGIGAISLILNYDNTKLTYLGYQNLNSALSVGLLIINSTGNKVVISWANTTAANLGTSTMVQLRFTGIPGTSTLAWDTQTPGNCEYSDVNGNVLAATFTNGIITVNLPPVISVQPTDKTVLVGQNTNFSVTSAGTGLAYLWQISTNGGGAWTDLSNNATYSNVTGSTLYLTNALLTYNGYKYRCRLTGTCTPVIYSDVVTLTVVNPITTTLPTASSCPGNIVVPVTVTNFTGVAAFSLAFSYNTSCLTYTGYQALNGALTTGLLAVNASGGQVLISWSNTTAATFGTGTIIELLFSTVTGISGLTWDIGNEGQCEYSTLGGSLITSVFVNGAETIYALPSVSVHPTNKIIAKGQNTTFSAATAGSGLTHLWQVSTNGGGLFTDLTNSGYYSGVTTTTLTVTGAQLAISGYQYRCKVTGTCLPVVYSNPATLTVLPNIITTCGSATGCPGQVIIPVNVTDFIGVASFSLALNFNSSVLTFTGTQNLNAAVSGGYFSANAVGDKVFLTWSNISAATIATGGLLVELKFNGVPGASSLTWDTQTPGNCEFADINGLVIFSTWNNGNATINTPPAITVHPVNKTIYATGTTSFSVTATGTGLAYIWQVSTNGGGVWTSLTNASPYTGAFTNTLAINPAATGMNGYLYHCIVSGTCTPADTSNSAQLMVTQNAITTTPSAVTNSCTGNLNIAMNVINCNNVGSISLTLVYDTAKMSFQGYHSVNAALSGGLLAVNSVDNKVYMTWASTSATNIGAGILIQYRFRAKSGISTTLTWDTQSPGACEYSDINGLVITSIYNTSNISVAANALIVDAGPDMIMTGPSVQLNGSATGATTPYTWLWAPAGSLSSATIPNPIASPTATTTYTLTVTATGGCVGTDVMDVLVGVIPQNLTLQGITIPNGTTNCYNALQTITVAGSGTTFIVQNGGSATMIAGMKISYLAGTKVQPGGYMHGYITTNGQYCTTTSPPMVATAVDETTGSKLVNEVFRIFPNPTSGSFTVELTDGEAGEKAELTAWSSLGKIILSGEMNGISSQVFSLEGKPSGIYMIKVIHGSRQETRKLVKQ